MSALPSRHPVAPPRVPRALARCPYLLDRVVDRRVPPAPRRSGGLAQPLGRRPGGDPLRLDLLALRALDVPDQPESLEAADHRVRRVDLRATQTVSRRRREGVVAVVPAL